MLMKFDTCIVLSFYKFYYRGIHCM